MERLLAQAFDPCRIAPAADNETRPAPRPLTRLFRREVKMVAHRSTAAAALTIGLALVAAPASATLLTYRADLIPANPEVNSQVSGTATFVLDTSANTLSVTVNASGL